MDQPLESNTPIIIAPNGDYTIEVVAAAPEQINITLKVVFKGKEILNETVPYSNYVVESFTLPGGVNYKFLAIYNITNLPSLSNTQWNSRLEWNRILYGRPPTEILGVYIETL
jgi:hypothetical protein